MKCFNKKQWLKYLKGEADKEIRNHIEECEKCRETAQRLMETYKTLNCLEGLDADPQFAAIVTAEIRKKHKVRTWERVVLPAVAAAAAAVSICLGIFLGHNLYAVMQVDNSGQPGQTAVTHYYEGASVELYIQEGSL
ncbi:hypothetical protein GF359_02270 [candidate division WOR-3 bacterium]|uniref:Zinc-finger domain-containing protein n=1 Tax=candidate division WOR-3 bacterium TaxID=2052148 RepID=A0A9D5QC07_UNCW3|nr:hypothetical protein [candidate division WOR-3 bacterium]MBD3364019.1 hypothetical protein [candidate division WOR-3 bacterium]